MQSRGLKWLKKALTDTLNSARTSLELYSQDQTDKEQLRLCIDYLRQLHGALILLDLSSATLLTSEMNRCAHRLSSEAEQSSEQILELLMRSILQMNAYLEYVERHGREIPLTLLPLINELRALTDATPVSESALYAEALPSLEALSEDLLDITNNSELSLTAQRLRPKYEMALVAIYRDIKLNEQFSNLVKVASELERLASYDSVMQFWWVVNSLFQALESGDLPLNIVIKRLLGQIDRELKRLIDQGEAELAQNPPNELFQSLLYYLAQGNRDNERIRQAIEQYALHGVVQQERELDKVQSALSGVDEALLKSVSVVLKEDVVQVKDILDLFIRDEQHPKENLNNAITAMQHIANTFGMIGLHSAQQVVNQQISALQLSIERQQRPARETVIAIAGSLLSIEALLNSLSVGQLGLWDEEDENDAESLEKRVAKSELTDVQHVVLQECQRSITGVKEALTTLIDEDDSEIDYAHLVDAIQQVSGSLEVVGLHKASDLCKTCYQYLASQEIDQLTGQPVVELDFMADAVVSIEHYIGLVLDGRSESESILDAALHNLAQLTRLSSLETEDEATSGLDTEQLSVADEAIPDAITSTPSRLPNIVLRDGYDQEFLDIFIEEAEDELGVIAHQLEAWQSNHANPDPVATIRRSFHTLKGSGRLVGAELLGEFAWGFENLLNRLIERQLTHDDGVFTVITRAAHALPELVEQLRTGGQSALQQDLDPIVDEAWRLAEQMDQRTSSSAINNNELHSSSLDDVDGLALDVEELVDDDIEEIELAESVPVKESVLEHHTVITHEDYSESVEQSDQHADQVSEILDQVERESVETESQQITQSFVDLDGAINSVSDGLESASVPIELDGDDVEKGSDEDALLGIFLQEGQEFLERSEATLEHWLAEPSAFNYVAELQRYLHTLKGGARMVGIGAIANLSHGLESLFESIVDQRRVVSNATFDLVQQTFDQLLVMLDQVEMGVIPTEPSELVEQVWRLRKGEERTFDLSRDEIEREPDHEEHVESASQLDDDPQLEEETNSLMGSVSDWSGSRKSPEHDVIRVRADLLDSLVNNAGEVSILRSRLEQVTGRIHFNIEELGQTVNRLREQLRKFEIETETQILSHYEHETEQNVEFDPLELDQFGHMQELSRALMESVTDLGSIQELVEELAREGDTLLLQQERANHELQEGLMRTRMVPFASILPRLRRVMRQTARELGKLVELEVSGGTREMDRAVLEQMVAPFEHMIRNAVSHGIEKPDQRRALGKSETGRIRLNISRQGEEIVIKLSDDGSGIDLEGIRNKALSKGMVRNDLNLTDTDIIQFVLEPGISTATHVTQISGRGVGMDVVNAALKQLGGSLRMQTERDKGTEFIVHLAFTLTVNRALLVNDGEENYAIPLSSIEGVVRLSHDHLREYYCSESARYEYRGKKYRVLPLNTLLTGNQPQLVESKWPLPILLVRSGDYRAALQVSSLMGSREVVVKSIGPQLSTVRGISGATITGDGRVVLILDVGALIRIGAALHLAPKTIKPEEKLADSVIRVLVVDDSITMRKVATRLLERNNMQVDTAKDGVEALAKLNEQLPDLMLLDIEMPRMDGYELAGHVRNNPRTKDLPIIMITSRSGAKHRIRAMDLGIQDYIGKPYHESELLRTISRLVGERARYLRVE